MRVLLNFRRGFPALAEALRERGVEVVENDWSPADVSGIAVAMVDFYEAIRAPWRTLRLRARLRASGAPLAGLDRDAPWHKGVRRRRLWLTRTLPLLDIYATHSMQGATGFAPAQVYFPNAAWPRVYGLGAKRLEDLRDPAGYLWDVSFVGNIDGARYREHRARVEFLGELSRRLEARGLRVLVREASGFDPSAQVEVIQRSRVNLSVWAACDHGGQRSWGLPERCYGVPSCGGLLLCDHRHHAANDFEPGREWVDFEDIDECESRVLRLLADWTRARDVAEAAHRRVMAQHTYAHRARQLLDMAAAWRREGAVAVERVAREAMRLLPLSA